MQRTKRQELLGKNPWSRAAGRLVPAMALSWASASAQTILVPPGGLEDRVPTVQQAAEAQVGSYAPPLINRPEGPQKYPLELGPVRFHPHLGYQFIYGDGVLRGPNDPQTTVLHTISPGVSMELGRHWDLDFTSSLNRYSNAGANDSTDFRASVNGNIPLEKWLIRLGYQGGMTEQPQVQTGVQTKQTSHILGGSALYDYNSHWSFEANARQSILISEGFTDTYNWSTLEWANYHATDKTTVGVGLGGGYNLIDPGTNSTYQEVLGRMIWSPGPKLNAQASAGLRLQEFLPDQSDMVTAPFFVGNATVTYQLFVPTTLSINGGQDIGNAVLQGLFTQTRWVNAGLRQRLFGSLYLDVLPGYTFSEYRSTGKGLGVQRQDDYFTIYSGLRALLWKRLDVAIFYQYNDNSSTGDNATFDSTQLGFRLNYRY